MDNKFKMTVDFQGKEADQLMNFVIDTQEGKFTKTKPVVTNITFKKFEVEEQDFISSDEYEDQVLLFGVST